MTSEDREIVGTKVIAHKLGVSPRTVLRIIKKGDLRVFKYGDNSSKNRCTQKAIDDYKRRKRGD